jgi:ribonuclease P protein component
MKDFIVKKNHEISKLIAKRDSMANKYFITYKTKNNIEHFRYAISVGKKYGNAVQRNKIKRQIREIIRKISSEIKLNYDILIIVRPSVIDLDFGDIEKQINHVLSKAKII